MEIQELVEEIRQTGFEVHVYFKNGFLEKVYENALAHRLRKKGFSVRQQYPLKVFDEDGTNVGEYLADLYVGDAIIVELKAAKTLDDMHTAQILSYLKASRTRHGMLMNFGSQKFQVRKYIL